MSTEPSKYAQNQFLSGTFEDYPRMDEILADTKDRAPLVTAGIAEFSDPISALLMRIGAWDGVWMAYQNALASQPARTLAFEEKLASLTRSPGGDLPSPLTKWVGTIEIEVGNSGPIYTYLLPRGRETVTGGTLDERLDALDGLSSRLAEQTTVPALVTLAATVGTFATAARALRTLQTQAKSEVETTRATLETTRVACAILLYKLVACAMQFWGDTPELVDTIFDVNILRRPAQEIPDAPADTLWTPGTRTLSTTVLPARATRLTAWRIAPGGMPEQLHTGGFGETSVVIPATITWVTGGLYQIWLVGVNGSGSSVAGPVQNWTAA